MGINHSTGGLLESEEAIADWRDPLAEGASIIADVGDGGLFSGELPDGADKIFSKMLKDLCPQAFGESL